jgi:NADH:ubiquinone oxidoreductase subunit F (NADH-binding)
MQMNLSQEHSNRYLMEFIPHLLIEGMITSSFALGAKLSYIYIRGDTCGFTKY